MSDYEDDEPGEEPDEPEDPLLEEQIGKGYGEDEGERDDALSDDE